MSEIKRRMTDENARHYSILCQKDRGTNKDCIGCRYDDDKYDVCPSTWGSPLLAADLLEARELIKEMRESLNDLVGRMDVEGEDALFSFNKAEAILGSTKDYV